MPRRLDYKEPNASYSFPLRVLAGWAILALAAEARSKGQSLNRVMVDILEKAAKKLNPQILDKAASRKIKGEK